MHRLRPTVFTRVPRQTQSLGVAAIRLPLLALFRRYINRFLVQALRRLWRGRVPQDLEEWLTQFELHEAALRLEEWFGQLKPPPIALEWEAAQLRHLAEVAEDLAADDGRWSDRLAPAADRKREALTAVQARLVRLREAVTLKHGPQAAARVLHEVYRRLYQHAEQSKADGQRWNLTQADQLRAAARRVRAMAQPASVVWRFVRRLWPSLSPQSWLTRAQQAALRTQLLPLIQQAAAIRFDDVLRRHRREAYEQLVGTPGTPGLLQELHAKLADYRRLLQTLADGLATSVEPIRHATHEILLIDDLHAALDSHGELRFAQVIDQQVRQSGCSPQHFADHLLRDGLGLKGHTYFPAQWIGVAPSQLLSALTNEVSKYFGFEDPAAKLNPQRPRSAAEHVATITLDHPALRPLLQHKVLELARRSRPFAIFHPISEALPKPHAYLFCYPPHRRLLQELLQMQCNLVNQGNGHDDADSKYNLRSPYVATLTQYALAAPGGSQPDLHHALRHSNRLRRQATIPPLFAPQDYPEIRLLSERPDDIHDARQLFSAGQKAGLVVPIGHAGDRYQLANHEPRLECLFADAKLAAESRPAAFFQKLLHDSIFVNLVASLFPALRDWRQTVADLQHEKRPESVAEKLISLGVIRCESDGLYCLAAVPDRPTVDLPQGLYALTRGPNPGLTSDQFLAELMSKDSDWLYNALFWPVADAFDRGHLAPADTPDFVKRQLEAIG